MSKCERIPVLLVDGDPIFRQALADILRFDGHEVVECPSAEQALPVIWEKGCVALIAEYAMPGFNGVDLADEFRAARDGPTLIVTAQSPGSIAAHVQVRHYVRILPKPVAYDRLHDLLHDLVGGQKDS